MDLPKENSPLDRLPLVSRTDLSVDPLPRGGKINIVPYSKTIEPKDFKPSRPAIHKFTSEDEVQTLPAPTRFRRGRQYHLSYACELALS